MTNKEPQRARPVRKRVSFSEREWETVRNRMALAQASTFEEFARRAILDNEIRVRHVAFDPAPLGAELSRIGNNINQIARLANAESVATLEQVQATRDLVRQIQALIERAVKEAE